MTSRGSTGLSRSIALPRGAVLAAMLVSALAVLSMSGCSSETQTVSPGQYGSEIFTSPSLASPSTRNAYACSTCHVVGDRGARILSGGDLSGVTQRSSFWGGAELDLLRSVNHCRTYFMGATEPWSRDDEKALALYAFLEQSPGSSTPVAFTFPTSVSSVPTGDKVKGATVFLQACQGCHGEIHTGKGRLTARASIVPDDTQKEHAQYSYAEQRLTVIEKVRHGRFLGFGGEMPPFSFEVLPDTALSDLLSYIGYP